MLVKNYLGNQIVEVATPKSECILLKLKCLLFLTIMVCYIAPNDSQYHSFAPLAEKQNRVKAQPHDKYLVIGDTNDRFGNSRQAFLEDKHLPVGTLYRASPDGIGQPNSNAGALIELGCESLMVHVIATVYSCTWMILRTATLTTTTWVRQGSSYVLLFIHS